MYKVFCTRYQVSFYLWQIKLALEYGKLPMYCDPCSLSCIQSEFVCCEKLLLEENFTIYCSNDKVNFLLISIFLFNHGIWQKQFFSTVVNWGLYFLYKKPNLTCKLRLKIIEKKSYEFFFVNSLKIP